MEKRWNNADIVYFVKHFKLISLGNVSLPAAFKMYVDWTSVE